MLASVRNDSVVITFYPEPHMSTLYFSPLSQHSRRVVSLLEEAGIPYEPKLVDMMKGEFLSAEFIAINPNHQVPTLVDGDLKLHESHAILRYLCIKHDLLDWYPEGLAARAQVEQWLDWTQCRMSPAVVDIVFNRVFLAEKGDKTAIERGLNTMKELNLILDKALEGQDFITGGKPTIADLALASNIFHLGLAKEIPTLSNIQAWYGRMCEMEGFKKSLPNM